MRAKLSVLAPFEKSSFCFRFWHVNHVIKEHRHREIVDSFAYMSTGEHGLQGRINLKTPQLEIGLFEYHNALRTTDEVDPLGRLEHIFIGRQIATGQRHLVDMFDVKKRSYIGNTSMESETSLLMANQAQAAPGKLVYDPFVGTGSLLYVAAYLGAMAIGSDLDGRMIRGKVEGRNIWSSAAQYGVTKRILDCLVFDLSQHPWRMAGCFDAIITDPPYGVRAGAKQIGRYKPPRTVDPERQVERDRPWEDPVYVRRELRCNVHSHNMPPLKPWQLNDVVATLLDLSAFLLKPNGRLVFFIPVATDTYDPNDIPRHPALRLIANSPQNVRESSIKLTPTVREMGTKTDHDGKTAARRDRGRSSRDLACGQLSRSLLCCVQQKLTLDGAG